MSEKRFITKTRGFWPCVFLIFAFFPLLPLLVAAAVASFAGCRLDEGNAHPCVIVGTDFGGILYGMAVMGWLTLLTLLWGIFFLTGWLVMKIFTARRGKRKE